MEEIEILIITNQTIGNAEGKIVGFPFEGTVFTEAEKDESRVIYAETLTMGTFILRSLEDDENIVDELKRLAVKQVKGEAYDDENVYKQLG
jgi:hypothetical protein